MLAGAENKTTLPSCKMFAVSFGRCQGRLAPDAEIPSLLKRHGAVCSRGNVSCQVFLGATQSGWVTWLDLVDSFWFLSACTTYRQLRREGTCLQLLWVTLHFRDGHDCVSCSVPWPGSLVWEMWTKISLCCCRRSWSCGSSWTRPSSSSCSRQSIAQRWEQQSAPCSGGCPATRRLWNPSWEE